MSNYTHQMVVIHCFFSCISFVDAVYIHVVAIYVVATNIRALICFVYATYIY
jgi:hypothetical protein